MPVMQIGKANGSTIKTTIEFNMAEKLKSLWNNVPTALQGVILWITIATIGIIIAWAANKYIFKDQE